MPFIKVIEHFESKGQLRKIYDELVNSRGKLAEVHKIQSLNAKTILSHMNLYMDIMYKSSPISRVLREMIAVVVSKANDCKYCQQHHLEAVNHYWKDEDKSKKFLMDYHSVELDSRDLTACSFAERLTKEPMSERELEAQKMKDVGFTDREILDITLITSYFNYVNRMVLGLGVKLEDNPGGYSYDE